MTDATLAKQVDPFTLALEAIWNAVDAFEPLAGMVEGKNRIVRMGKRKPTRDRIQDSDLPELDCEPSDIANGTLSFSSSGVGLVYVYEFGITTGSRDLADVLFPLQWNIIRLVAKMRIQEDWAFYRLGLSFVKDVDVVTVAADKDDPIRNRAKSGWTSVMGIALAMSFDSDTQVLADVPELE